MWYVINSLAWLHGTTSQRQLGFSTHVTRLGYTNVRNTLQFFMLKFLSLEYSKKEGFLNDLHFHIELAI